MVRLIRLLLTAWIGLLALDALVNVIGNLWSVLGGGGMLLDSLRSTTSLGVMAMCPWVVLAWIVTPAAPSRIVVPSAVFVVWNACAALPLLLFLGLAPTYLITYTLQLGFALGVAAATYMRTGGWIVGSDTADGRLAIRPLRSLAAATLVFVVGPTVLAVHLIVNTDLALRTYTGGYARLSGDGLEFATRTLSRGDEAVILMGMVHIGERDTYASLLHGVPVEGTVIVEEGVSDRDNVLKGAVGYSKVAKALGLQEQQPMSVTAEGYDVVSGDVDVSSFSPATLELLGLVFSIQQADDAQQLAERFQAYAAHVAGDPDEMLSTLWDDILHARNRHLHQRILDELDDHERVVVPWGAYHMAELSQMLEEDGFEPGPPSWRTFIRWRTVLGRR
ncbi:MAG: hypothetical protein H6733_16615 [Alphaproteobacteria bacterium]|nr:hypothetical protein [Alphaproteobacteria bacterium]